MTDSLTQQVTSLTNAFDGEAGALESQPTPAAVEALRVAWLGRKGRITGLMEGLRDCAPAERPAAGKAINSLKQHVEEVLESLKRRAADGAIEAQLTGKARDISLPARGEDLEGLGSLHPVTLMRRELLRVFRRMGFTVYDGPEVDYDEYNFRSLNFPDDHPARDMQDTFYVKEQKNLVLRTHTSNIQIHCMLNERPPLRIVAPGRTFRCDSDATHTPMFHQIEAFVVDKDISVAHMKGVIDAFMKEIFGADTKTRLRPSFFPFVEPGAEMDVACVQCKGKGCRLCKQTGWLEMGGCGMIHPNVFEAVGYDSQAYTGFAFGFGMDRMAMIKYGLPDLRQLFEGDAEFLGQFPALGV